MKYNHYQALSLTLSLISFLASTATFAQTQQDARDSLFVHRENTVYHSSFDNGDEEPFYRLKICSKDLLPQDILLEPEARASFRGCHNKLGEYERWRCTWHKLLEFIYAELRYPVEDREAGIMGTVVVSIIIEADGLVSELYVLSSPGGALGKAAYMAVDYLRRKKVRFQPATYCGSAVRTVINLPVKFEVE